MKNFFQTIEHFGNRAMERMTPIRVLLFGNALLMIVLVMLSNLEILPLRFWDFIFFSVLFFLLALYRSGWVFALLVGMLPLEIVNLAPTEFGINLRPYQFLAVLLSLAVLVQFGTKRIRWPFFKAGFLDIILILFLVSGLFMIPFLPLSELSSVAIKQSVILLSFGLLYFLGRVFLKKESDVRIAIAFFLSSISVVLGYSLWQNLRFKFGLPDFEVMAGRPNGTFPEADFLGGMLAMIGAGMVPFGLSFFFHHRVSRPRKIIFSGFLFSVSLILVLTVARSGWLAVAIGTIIAGAVFFWRNGIFEALRIWDTEVLRRGVIAKLFIGIPIATAILVIIAFRLTTFDLLDRGQSLGSGLQKITVSCETTTTLPERIVRTEELEGYGCRHIDLDEVEVEITSGRLVTEVFRPDPNISLRRSIYIETWSLIRQYPITGIGWGNASHFLGTDGRGAGINTSNIFLQVWLEGGTLAFIAFMVFWFSFPIVLLRSIVLGIHERTAICLLASFTALTVFNGFNSGLLLGSLWIFFSILVWFTTSLGRETSK